MKISKYTGADMRQALRAVREQLGTDAVILSSRQVLTGIEVTAAIDFDAGLADRAAAAAAQEEAAFAPEEFHRSRRVAAQASQAAAAAAPSELNAVSGETEALGDELKNLRRILETQVAQLAWNDLSRRAPIHTEILRELTQIGFTAELATHVVAQLPSRSELTQARRLAIATISQEVPVTGDQWLEEGGCVALDRPDRCRQDDHAHEARRALGTSPWTCASSRSFRRMRCASALRIRCVPSARCWA